MKKKLHTRGCFNGSIENGGYKEEVLRILFLCIFAGKQSLVVFFVLHLSSIPIGSKDAICKERAEKIEKWQGNIHEKNRHVCMGLIL